MSETGEQSSQTWIQRWFPNRQIYLRTHGEVNFVPLSSRLQISIVTLFIVLLGWGSYTSGRVLFGETIIEAKNETIEDLNALNAEQDKQIERLQGSVMDKTRALEERTDYLLGLVEQDPTGDLSEGLEVSPGPDEEEIEEGDKTSALTLGNQNGTGFTQVFFSKAEASTGRLSGEDFDINLQYKFDVIAKKQTQMAATLSYFADQKIKFFDDMLSPYRIKAVDLAKATPVDWSTLGQGGAYLAGPNSSDDVLSGISPYPELHKSWQDLIKIYSGLQSVPLLFPVTDFFQSSRFGSRTDPITKKAGWHPGVDLAGWPGTEIYSPTAGVVTKAGLWGTYGNMVEVNHGNGFKTRYAHLRKIKVKRGQTVLAGEVLGEMGCSGRCVSTHLHYEVFFNNTLRNPQPFMEPEEDVQQTKRQATSSYRKGK